MYRAGREAEMADYTQSPPGGEAPHENPDYGSDYRVGRHSSIGKLTNLTGAVVSLALVAGVGVWGYKLLVRDVSGIPVVRAAAGEMRVRPEDPGGQLARHQGLSVNKVASVGASEDRADELRLAPKPVDLAEEDQPMQAPVLVAGAAVPEADYPAPVQTDLAVATEDDIEEALTSGSVDSIVAQLTQGIVPLEGLGADEAEENTPVLASVSATDVPEALGGAGMQVSLRPSVRPAGARAAATPAAAAVTAPSPSTSEIDADSLPVGTRLVQLGAFDSPEIARAQWGQLSARFAPFMEGKHRIVMQAKSGGRTFYRLRAQGFEDIGDARRFCSALVAESVDCIPVVTR